MKTLKTLVFMATLSGVAHAQPSFTLPGAVNRALQNAAEVNTARANLVKAQANLRAVKADPTSIITTLTTAEQEVTIRAVMVEAAKLSVTQKVIASYTSLLETQGRINLNTAQVALDGRNLQIVQAKLTARVATPLDVSRVQTSLNGNRQELADAQAQLPVQMAQLTRLLGLPGNTNLNLAAPPAPPKLAGTLASYQSGLEDRLSPLVEAGQAVDTAQLQVKLSSNDYTPVRTLQDAQVALSNAQRTLIDLSKAAQTEVRDTHRAVLDAKERLQIAAQQLTDARTGLAQAQAKLKAGTAATIDVQAAKVKVQQAELSYQQAANAIWRTLASLSVAAGRDATTLP